MRLVACFTNLLEWVYRRVWGRRVSVLVGMCVVDRKICGGLGFLALLCYNIMGRGKLLLV
jgi:hypothetical protein